MPPKTRNKKGKHLETPSKPLRRTRALTRDHAADASPLLEGLEAQPKSKSRVRKAKQVIPRLAARAPSAEATSDSDNTGDSQEKKLDSSPSPEAADENASLGTSVVAFESPQLHSTEETSSSHTDANGTPTPVSGDLAPSSVFGPSPVSQQRNASNETRTSSVFGGPVHPSISLGSPTPPRIPVSHEAPESRVTATPMSSIPMNRSYFSENAKASRGANSPLFGGSQDDSDSESDTPRRDLLVTVKVHQDSILPSKKRKSGPDMQQGSSKRRPLFHPSLMSDLKWHRPLPPLVTDEEYKEILKGPTADELPPPQNGEQGKPARPWLQPMSHLARIRLRDAAAARAKAKAAEAKAKAEVTKSTTNVESHQEPQASPIGNQIHLSESDSDGSTESQNRNRPRMSQPPKIHSIFERQGRPVKPHAVHDCFLQSITNLDLLAAMHALKQIHQKHPDLKIPTPRELEAMVVKFNAPSESTIQSPRRSSLATKHNSRGDMALAENHMGEDSTLTDSADSEDIGTDDEEPTQGAVKPSQREETNVEVTTPRQQVAQAAQAQQARGFWSGGVSAVKNLFATPASLFGSRRRAAASASSSHLMPNQAPMSVSSSNSLSSTPTLPVPGAFQNSPTLERKRRPRPARTNRQRTSVNHGSRGSQSSRANVSQTDVRQQRQEAQRSQDRMRRGEEQNRDDDELSAQQNSQTGNKRKKPHRAPNPGEYRVPDSSSDEDSEDDAKSTENDVFYGFIGGHDFAKEFAKTAPPLPADMQKRMDEAEAAEAAERAKQSSILKSAKPKRTWGAIQRKKVHWPEDDEKKAASPSDSPTVSHQSDIPDPPQTPRPSNAELPQQAPDSPPKPQSAQKYKPATPSRLREVTTMSPQDTKDEAAWVKDVIDAVMAYPMESPFQKTTRDKSHFNEIERAVDAAF